MKALLSRASVAWDRLELGLAGLALLLMAVLPVVELSLGWVHIGFKGSVNYVQNLTLWVGFLGAMIASRQKKHLTLTTGIHLLPPLYQRIARVFSSLVSVTVSTGLAWASATFVRSEMASPNRIADWLPAWIPELILPVSFAVMTLRFVGQAGDGKDRAIAFLGIPLAAALGFGLADHAAGPPCWEPRSSSRWAGRRSCSSSPTGPRWRRCRSRPTDS
jgi:TRAP-type C4-dicarboxylate transport system permease small subunit